MNANSRMLCILAALLGVMAGATLTVAVTRIEYGECLEMGAGKPVRYGASQ